MNPTMLGLYLDQVPRLPYWLRSLESIRFTAGSV